MVEQAEAGETTEPGLVVLVDPSGKLAQQLREVLRQLVPAAPAGDLDAEPARPGPRLTAREIEVLLLVAQQRSNSEIARDLWVSQDTVRFHLRNVYRKLGVHERGDAVRKARASGAFEAREVERG